MAREEHAFGNGAPRVAVALRILIVDDEALIRWSLSETLSSSGCTVVEAGDAAGAVRAVTATTRPFDVVLLDFRLPDSDGLGLLARLRLLAPQARIIMMTAFGTPEMRRAALDLGAHCVLDKPFELHEVIPLLATPKVTTR
jgi:DNA-binding response OmpR family regulator